MNLRYGLTDIARSQEYLARHIVLPTLAISPSTKFHPLPPSRSTSSTRKSSSLPSSYLSEQSIQPIPYPSPASNMSFHSSDNATKPSPAQRPATLRRTSSYGFESIQAPGSPSGFEGDAFAPLSQQVTDPQASDSWSRYRTPTPGADSRHSPWAAFGVQQPSFAYRPSQQYADPRNQHAALQSRAPPTPPDEDDEMCMDEDMVDEGMVEETQGEEEDDEEAWWMGEGEGNQQVDVEWQRGRRKA